MILRTVATCSMLVFFFAAEAVARNTEHFYPVNEAVNSSLGKQKLLDVPFYFAGQKYPGKKKVLGEWNSHKSTRGVFRSDNNACQIAFLSALISLQQRVEKEGGNAVVDIKSITRSKETSSPTEYRCVAGATVVHVALGGTVVKLK